MRVVRRHMRTRGGSVPPAYAVPPAETVRDEGWEVHRFTSGVGHRDEATIASSGDEWERFGDFDPAELERIGEEYFDVLPEDAFGPDVVALDLGCGSGRWSRYLSGRVGWIDAIDPSDAIFHAARRHRGVEGVRWSQADVDHIPFAPGTFDLIVCLGVLHHVPDTAEALKKAVERLKPGGCFLLYLYYALDGRGALFRLLFRGSGLIRRVVSQLPIRPKQWVCDALAVGVYLPLRQVARVARRVDAEGRWWERLPLSYYHDKSMTVMRNDALDRFGTPLEQRFTKGQVEEMMRAAGLTEIRFSPTPPFWHAAGRRAEATPA